MKHRLELFSDAVLAIVITIMVLDLKTPVEGGWHGFLPILPTVAIYAAGFLQVAVLWAFHHNFFAKAERITRPMLWANFAFLFFVSLLPLLIRSIGEHPKAPAETAAFIGLGWVTNLCLTLFRMATKSQHAGDDDHMAWQRRRNRSTFLIGVPLAAVMVSVTYLSPVVGLALYAATMIWALAVL
jgi:uncharacterized membrane protein